MLYFQICTLAPVHYKIFASPQDDNNTGTYPLQSERFYAALKGHGAPARLVLLPHESHGALIGSTMSARLFRGLVEMQM